MTIFTHTWWPKRMLTLSGTWKQEEALQQVQAAEQASLPPGPYDLPYVMILEVTSSRKRHQDFTANPNGKISNQMLPFLDQAHGTDNGELHIFQ